MQDYDKWRFWLGVAQILGYVILWAWVYWSNRQKATTDQITAVREEMQGIKDKQSEKCNLHIERTSALEVQFKAAPTHSDLGAVYDKISTVKGVVDEINGSLKALTKQVSLLIEYHMQQRGKE